MKYGLKRWRIPFWLTVTAIVYLGTKSSANTQLFPDADKFYHWIAFAVLTFTGHMAFKQLPLPLLAACVITGSGCIEILQFLSPDRTPSLADLLVNVVGVLTGLAAIEFMRNEERRVNSAPAHLSRSRHRRHRSRSNRDSDFDEDDTRHTHAAHGHR